MFEPFFRCGRRGAVCVHSIAIPFSDVICLDDIYNNLVGTLCYVGWFPSLWVWWVHLRTESAVAVATRDWTV
jgi:hypothetical protein